MNLSRFIKKFNIGNGHKSTSGGEYIEFVCDEELYGVIPEPIPANNALPEWYKQLEGKMDVGLNQSTVKRCAPFLDALTAGWIIPLAGEVEFVYDAKSGDYEASQNFSRKLIDNHSPEQVAGEDGPFGHLPILKFINHWAFKVPDGYSVLVTQPFNRLETRFKPFSGVVDADNYFNTVNFPAIWTGGSYHGVLDKGTPLVQVILFKRDSIIGDGTIRSMTLTENEEQKKSSKQIEGEESFYRNNIWEPKTGSRVVDRDESKKDDGESNCPFHY